MYSEVKMTPPFKPGRRLALLWVWTVVCTLVVCGCGSSDGEGNPGVQVDCKDLCSKSSECLGTDEALCFGDCLEGYDEPEIECLRLCDRQSECLLYTLCATYCILAE